MITVEDGELKELHLFMAPIDADMLEDIAVQEDGWKKGRAARQNEEYFKLDIRDLIERGATDEDLAWLWDLGARALNVIRRYADMPELDDRWDAYLLYYPRESRIHPHVDPAPAGYRHIRLNAVVKEPEEGGIFSTYALSGDGLYSTRQRTYQRGQAVVFSPSEITHGVSTINEGARIVFSVGALVPA